MELLFIIFTKDIETPPVEMAEWNFQKQLLL
jgi:hypothetical protein